MKISSFLTSGSFFHRKLSEIDLIPKGSKFSHLVASGEIVFKKDSDFDIPQVEINISGYFPALVRVSLEGRGVGNNNQNILIDCCIDCAP